MLSILTLCFAVFAFVTNYRLYESFVVAAVSAAIMVVALGLFILLYPKYYKKALKKSIGMQKKTGKLSYPPSAVLEFYDDYYVENEPESTTRQNYTAFERISYIPGKAIYIHTGSTKAVLLPVHCFVSEEELNSFLQFITSVCPHFDTYKK